MVSNRSRARAKARSVSKASASRHSMLSSPLSAALAAPRARAPRALESSASTLPARRGQVDGERAVVGEAVERPPARAREPAGQEAVGPLIEKGARSSVRPRARPGSGPPPSRTSISLGHGARAPAPTRRVEPLAPAHRRVVAEQDAVGLEELDQRVDDRLAHRLEAGGEQLDHQPAVVAVHHQRGETVALAVDQPVGGRVDAGSAGRRGGEVLPPPRRVHRAIGALEQPQPDLGCGRVERLADEPAARVVDRAPGPARPARPSTSLR